MKIRRAAQWCCLFYFLTAAGAAVAQPYPAKPVRFVIPYAPGGGTDLTARPIAVKLTERWGKSEIPQDR